MSRRFSIIIVHRNGADMLLETLACVARACDPARDEIILVDNASRDDSVRRAADRHPAVHVIGNSCNNGFARACNQAIARAQGEFMLLLNNDARPAPDVLNLLEAAFRRFPRAAVVAGQLVDAAGQAQRSAGRIPTALDELGLGFLRRTPRLPAVDGLTEVESVVGACMAVRRAAIEQAGPLDGEFFFYFEDTEWCHRLRRHGWQVLLEPAARVAHLKGASTRGGRRGAQIEALRSRLIFYRATMNAPLALVLTGYRVLRLSINAAVNLLATLVTLGLHARLREKTAVYFLQLAWLLLGRPDHWGLPDKCPRGYPGTPS
jgi:GT2 family glycosyltransferase